jgi:hypothetical protein
MPSSSARALELLASSARSIAERRLHDLVAGGSMWRASRSGVWPPNWVTTPLGLLTVENGEHLLRRERLEVEAVGGVVVRRDRLRVAAIITAS